MGLQSTHTDDTHRSTTLMGLPPEIREQIYMYLFVDITLTPTPPLTTTTTAPLRIQPYTHSCLGLLATSHLIHAEAYPHLVRAASLALRTPADHARLYSPSLQEQGQHDCHQQQQWKEDLPYPSERDILPSLNLDRCCRPALAEVHRLVLAWPLLCAWDRRGEAQTILGFGSYQSPSETQPQARSHSQAGGQHQQQKQSGRKKETTTNMMLPRLRELALRDIAVGVVHARLCKLWNAQGAVGGCRTAGAVDGNSNANTNSNGGATAASEKGLLLVQGLMCQLPPAECDLLLGTLDAARGRWRVDMAWVVQCSSCGLLPQSEAQSSDWQVQLNREGAALRDVGCPIGIVGVEVGIEL